MRRIDAGILHQHLAGIIIKKNPPKCLLQSPKIGTDVARYACIKKYDVRMKCFFLE